ncbi:hypothetical protein ACLB2K_013989 [Fragaria x ananassa]
MARSSQLTHLILLLLATTATARPGFLFTRTTGRCTPDYWGSRVESWPRMVPQTSTVSKVFGSRAYQRYRSDLTLMEATARNDDENVFPRLLKEASAALINSYARKGFPYTAWEVKTRVIQGLVSERAAARQAQVKESFGIGKEQASGPSRASADHVADEKDGSKASSTEDKHQHSGASDTAETLFGKFRLKVPSSNVSSVLNRFKEAKFVDMAKRGYEIVKDELNGSQSRKKHLGFDPSSIPRVERSATSDIAIVPTKQSPWSKKWEAFKMKMQGNPLFKRISGISEPVKIKGEEIIDDMKERWENSDSPIVHKIQDINESIFQETNAAASIKEIHARDPSFSLPDFVEEVQNAVKPVLNAYMKADIETLKKYCANEVIERCKAERQAYQSHDIFFDNKILHISDVQVVETKLIGDSPVIIVRFQTQQIYCVRDKNGAITDGSQDTIQTVIYGWAMQPWDPEELPEGALFPIWRVREMQQFRMLSLI